MHSINIPIQLHLSKFIYVSLIFSCLISDFQVWFAAEFNNARIRKEITTKLETQF